MSAPFRFGPFTLDPENGLVLAGSEPLALSHRAIALLQCLLEAGGRPVTKPALFEAAWPGLAVEDANLTVQIAALRKALGKRPDGQDWIVTLPRVGYRLTRADPVSGAPLPALADLPRLAVLPFGNLMADPAQNYFVIGVADDIATALSRFHSFVVVAHKSVPGPLNLPADTRQVAQYLGVGYLLQGSLRRAADRLRITARLTDGQSGEQLWAGTFDGADAQVFAFQDQITASVAAIVEPRLQAAELLRSRRNHSGSLTAYDLYLQALPRWASNSPTGVAEAKELLLKATLIEPGNATYLSLLLNSIQMEFGMGRDVMEAGVRDSIVAMARKALEYGPDDALVMARCAISLVHIRTDYEWAVALARDAISANPNSPSVVVMAAIVELHAGSAETALSLFQRSVALSSSDPLRHSAFCGMAHACLVLDRPAEALDAATQALAANPVNDVTYWMLIAANVHLGRMDEARKYLSLYLGHNPRATLSAIRQGQPAKDAARIEPVLKALKLAGLPA